MRIWSLHPKYLDPPGLVALWREGLLAQAVLRGKTKGYARHPQLVRFREQPSPLGAIAEYLRIVLIEAVTRGYHFDARKIGRSRCSGQVDVTRGQLQYEWRHLLEKLRSRNPQWRAHLEAIRRPQPHPLFRVHRGPRAEWEKGKQGADGPPYSQANKERLRNLLRQGKVVGDVAASLGDIQDDAFAVPRDILAAIKSDKDAWRYFQEFSKSYVRIRIGFIEGARARPQEFEKRLRHFIDMTAKNRQYGFGGIEKYY